MLAKYLPVSKNYCPIILWKHSDTILEHLIKNPKGSVLGKHLVTPTFLLTAHTVTTLNVEQMSKQMCRNKYDIAIVPLPKALANYQLVFFGGGSFVHLFWGCWDFFFCKQEQH